KMLVTDDDAKAMLKEYNNIPMPNQSLTDAEIRQYLKYFEWVDAQPAGGAKAHGAHYDARAPVRRGASARHTGAGPRLLGRGQDGCRLRSRDGPSGARAEASRRVLPYRRRGAAGGRDAARHPRTGGVRERRRPGNRARLARIFFPLAGLRSAAHDRGVAAGR